MNDYNLTKDIDETKLLGFYYGNALSRLNWLAIIIYIFAGLLFFSSYCLYFYGMFKKSAFFQVKKTLSMVTCWQSRGSARALFAHVRHQGDRASALDGGGKLALVLGAGAGHAAGQDLAALAGEAAEPVDILVIDVLDLIHAKFADLPARLAATGTANALATIFRHVVVPPFRIIGDAPGRSQRRNGFPRLSFRMEARRRQPR